MTAIEARKLWKPKHKEVEHQCASCPFRTGNDAEFGAIVSKLLLDGKRATLAIIKRARLAIRIDLEEHHTGDFCCHFTVYNEDGTKKPQSEWLQCKGASAAFKGEQ